MIRITTSSFSPMIMVQPKKLMNSFLVSSGSMLIDLIMTAVVGWKIKSHRETQLLKLSFHCPFSIWCRIVLH